MICITILFNRFAHSHKPIHEGWLGCGPMLGGAIGRSRVETRRAAGTKLLVAKRPAVRSNELPVSESRCECYVRVLFSKKRTHAISLTIAYCFADLSSYLFAWPRPHLYPEILARLCACIRRCWLDCVNFQKKSQNQLFSKKTNPRSI